MNTIKPFDQKNKHRSLYNQQILELEQRCNNHSPAQTLDHPSPIPQPVEPFGPLSKPYVLPCERLFFKIFLTDQLF